jgi:hypothetical protein
MPFSPRLTKRPSEFHVRSPATLVASGFCKAPTHYPCFAHRYDLLRSSPALRRDGDEDAEVFLLRAAPGKVALPGGMQILIPEWMLDEDHCRGMEIVEHPTLAITALFALRELIDAQPCAPTPKSTVASEASSPGGASDEPTTPGSSALGDSPHTGVAAGHATALPRVTKSLAAGSRQPNPNRRRGGER